MINTGLLRFAAHNERTHPGECHDEPSMATPNAHSIAPTLQHTVHVHTLQHRKVLCRWRALADETLPIEGR
jgi:hypothetical protein